MHDPLTVAFEIRRPWPRNEAWRTENAAREGVRWRFRAPGAVIAGRGYYWPRFITVWHCDPGGDYNAACKMGRSRRWRWHVHHWHIQVALLQELRRRLLTRCETCGGRSTKKRPVNVATQWDRNSGPWWRGETGLTHMKCPETA